MACAPSSQSIAKHFPPFSKALTSIMIDILIAIAFLLYFTYVMYVEYKNPLWNEFVSRGADIPEVNGNQHSIEMVFFWKNCSTYKESTESVSDHFRPSFPH